VVIHSDVVATHSEGYWKGGVSQPPPNGKLTIKITSCNRNRTRSRHCAYPLLGFKFHKNSRRQSKNSIYLQTMNCVVTLYPAAFRAALKISSNPNEMLLFDLGSMSNVRNTTNFGDIIARSNLG